MNLIFTKNKPVHGRHFCAEERELKAPKWGDILGHDVRTEIHENLSVVSYTVDVR
jgi:hypothetical protein